MTENRRVLLVGGAGYVGNVMARRMLAAGWDVTVLDRLIFDHGSAIAPLLENPGFTFVHGDLRDESAVERSLEGVTDVALLAGEQRVRPELIRLAVVLENRLQMLGL